MAKKIDVMRNVEKQILCDLLRYAEIFKAETGISDTSIGREALNDPSFISDIKSGKRNLTVAKYDQVIRFFDSKIKARANAAS